MRSSTAHVRKRRARAGRLVGAGLLTGLVAALSVFVLAGTAFAQSIDFTGQGTNADGACGTFEGQPPQPGGTQTWQFNLTQTQPGATMSASFSDGTTVTDKAEDEHNGKVSKWFITTATGATVTSASADFTPDGDNSQFVVSHCTAGGEPTPPPSGGVIEVGGVSAERPLAADPVGRPAAAVAVVGVARFTG